MDGAIDGIDQHLGLEEFEPRPLGLVAIEWRGEGLCEGVAVVDHPLPRLIQCLKPLAHSGIRFLAGLPAVADAAPFTSNYL